MEEKTEDNARLRKVRRKLFHDESDDNEQRKRNNIDGHFSEELMRKQLEQNTKRWNFDFVHGEPLPGRYEWIKLDEQGNEISESKERINGKINAGKENECAEEAENNAEHLFDKSTNEKRQNK